MLMNVSPVWRIKGMEFIEFGFVNIDEIDEINKGRVKDNYGRLGDNITANDLRDIISVYQNGEYDFGHLGLLLFVIQMAYVLMNKVSGEHRLKGKKLTPLVDISKKGTVWIKMVVAICRFDTLEALRDYSLKRTIKSLSFVKRFSSKESSIANIVEYLKALLILNTIAKQQFLRLKSFLGWM